MADCLSQAMEMAESKSLTSITTELWPNPPQPISLVNRVNTPAEPTPMPGARAKLNFLGHSRSNTATNASSLWTIPLGKVYLAEVAKSWSSTSTQTGLQRAPMSCLSLGNPMPIQKHRD